ncbi:MAG: branched-chain amino acid transport system ATP-binding protein [Gammaproteobacteria bacterium]|jgi:branched-chain amino acid transport system ATP-binding protein
MIETLRVEDVTVRYGGVTAVENVNLTINPGQLVGFIGPNGAGKTTLMRSITGIVQPDNGRVWLEGRDITNLDTHLRIRAGLALAQQIVQPLRALSLLDNVALACGSVRTRHPLKSMFIANRDSEQQTARELLSKVGLSDVVDEFPSTLPLGYLKRLEVARALALKPKLLLLDEPLAGLNQSEAESLANLISDINAQGQTILLIEHNLREVLRVCPILYVQDNGRPLAFGNADEVMSNPDVRRAYLGANHA